jgi:hypothetical protein
LGYLDFGHGVLIFFFYYQADKHRLPVCKTAGVRLNLFE